MHDAHTPEFEANRNQEERVSADPNALRGEAMVVGARALDGHRGSGRRCPGDVDGARLNALVV